MTDAIMTVPEAARCDAAAYDEDYFERGVVVGKSGYMNYSWMPELTIRMAHFMVTGLRIGHGQRVLDYGCAKGFLVRALRLLGIDAEGVDLSRYAIDNVDTAVRAHCRRIDGVADGACFRGRYDLMIAKDVFEHIPEEDLRVLLRFARGHCDRLFAVIPLAHDDHRQSFIVPEYNKDVTHVTARSSRWWLALFEECGWRVDDFSHSFVGIKENWTAVWPDGNGFFTVAPAP